MYHHAVRQPGVVAIADSVVHNRAFVRRNGPLAEWQLHSAGIQRCAGSINHKGMVGTEAESPLMSEASTGPPCPPFLPMVGICAEMMRCEPTSNVAETMTRAVGSALRTTGPCAG